MNVNSRKNWEWIWPSNTGSANSDSASPRLAELRKESQTITEQQVRIERENSRRQMLQEECSEAQRKFRSGVSKNHSDKVKQTLPYDNGNRTREKIVWFDVSKITLDDIMKLNSEKKTGPNTWEIRFTCDKDAMKDKDFSRKSHDLGTKRRYDDVMGMNERRTLADMVEFGYEEEVQFEQPELNSSRAELHAPKRVEAIKIKRDKDDEAIKIKRNKDEDFRIAIPRGPSIVWDAERGGSSERKARSRYGLGY